jgi:hypothetical protein
MTKRDILGLNSPLDDTLSDCESDSSISLEYLNLDASIFSSKDILLIYLFLNIVWFWRIKMQ